MTHEATGQQQQPTLLLPSPVGPLQHQLCLLLLLLLAWSWKLRHASLLLLLL
jgi:hypothetical protein